MPTLTASQPVAAPRSNSPTPSRPPEIIRRQRYDLSMTPPVKRKVSVTLDADLVAAIEADDSTTLSAEVNAALRAAVEKRLRNKALGEFLDRLDAERGPLDTPEDEAEIRRHMINLGGDPDEPWEGR
jgi:uncharacterized protein (DUF4415 family)